MALKATAILLTYGVSPNRKTKMGCRCTGMFYSIVWKYCLRCHCRRVNRMKKIQPRIKFIPLRDLLT